MKPEKRTFYLFEVSSGRVGCSFERVYTIQEERCYAMKAAHDMFIASGITHHSLEITAQMPIIPGICSSPSDEGLEFDSNPKQNPTVEKDVKPSKE